MADSVATTSNERFYMDRFLEQMPEYSEVLHRDSPDFLLRDTAGEIGFEVRMLYRDEGPAGSLLRAAESRRDFHLREVRRAYAAIGGKPVDVLAHVPERPSADPVVVARRFVEHRSELERVRVRCDVDAAHAYDLLSLPLSYPGEPYWRALDNSLGLVRRESMRQVAIDRIAEKAKRLDTYRLVAARVGLLLVVAASQVSGFIRWDEPDWSFDSEGFDVVYLLLHPGGVRGLARKE